MNTRLFIGEVRTRRALWDHSDKNYHNKKALSDGWREIAIMFGMEVTAAKQKWKNLRDTYRVELKKTNRYNPPDSTETPTRSLWAYYDDMSFIKDIFKTRRSGPSSEPVPSSSENGHNHNFCENVKIEQDSYVAYSPTSHITEENDASRDNSSMLVIENVTSLQPQSEDVDTTQKGIKRKKSNDSDHDQDDDLLFFRSLLPFVKKLDQDKKLLFRMNVQQMLYNQLYD